MHMLNLELTASIQADKQRRPDRTSLLGDSDHAPDYDAADDDALTSLKQLVHATITEGQTMLATPVRI